MQPASTPDVTVPDILALTGDIMVPDVYDQKTVMEMLRVDFKEMLRGAILSLLNESRGKARAKHLGPQNEILVPGVYAEIAKTAPYLQCTNCNPESVLQEVAPSTSLKAVLDNNPTVLENGNNLFEVDLVKGRRRDDLILRLNRIVQYETGGQDWDRSTAEAASLLMYGAFDSRGDLPEPLKPKPDFAKFFDASRDGAIVMAPVSLNKTGHFMRLPFHERAALSMPNVADIIRITKEFIAGELSSGRRYRAP